MNIEVELFATFLGMFKRVFKSLSLVFINIEDSSFIITKASHSFDVHCDVFWYISSDYIPNKTDSVERMLKIHLISYTFFLTIKQRSADHIFLMTSRHKSQCFHESSFYVAIIQCDELIGCVSKKGKNLIIDWLKLLKGITRSSLKYIIRLGYTNLCKFNSCSPFNILQFKFLFHCPKSDACTWFTSSSCTTCSMNISFNIFWWFYLDHKVYVGNIKATRCHISSY